MAHQTAQEDLHSLLLLPSPPNPSSRAALSAAFRPAIAAAIASVRSLRASESSPVLEIFVRLSPSSNRLKLPRSQIFEECQKLLAGIYSIACIVSVKESSEIDGPGSVDVRVVLSAYEDAFEAENWGEASKTTITPGPITDIPTLALSRRKWTRIFSIDGEAGEALLSSYTQIVGLHPPPLEGNIETVRGGVSMVANVASSRPLRHDASSTHVTVAVGGTFDHLHAGHKLLLTATALLLQPKDDGVSAVGQAPRRLIVGITGDELLKKKQYVEHMRSWQQRQEDVVDFLKTVILFTHPRDDDSVETVVLDKPGPNGKAVRTIMPSSSMIIECVEIQDPFGPTITDESISALVVSGETRSGGEAVNTKREDNGLKKLEVFEVDVLDANDETDDTAARITDPDITVTKEFASKISSTAIRKRKAEIAQNLGRDR